MQLKDVSTIQERFKYISKYTAYLDKCFEGSSAVYLDNVSCDA